MTTEFCARPILPTPPSTPPPGANAHVSSTASDFSLTDEADVVWLSALSVARSLRQSVKPLHIAIALLCENIKTFEDAQIYIKKPPILDIPLLWNVIQRVGGDPLSVGRDLTGSVLLQPCVTVEQRSGDYYTPDIRANSSPETMAIFDAAKHMMENLDDAYIAPHHLILAVLDDADVNDILNEHRLKIESLKDVTTGLRTRRVRSQKTEPRFSVLKQFSMDLTELAKAGKFVPIIGRDEELRRLIVILSRRTKNNAVLLGEPGVGKTAIAQGLALRIINRDVPYSLNARMFSLDMGSLLASTTCHGKLELRVKAVVEEIQRNEDDGVPIILHIDDLHLIVTGKDAGGAGGMDTASLMKPLLARGKLRCFGATTFADYKRHLETDGSLARRFAQIIVCEPTVPQTTSILRGLRPTLQKHHGVEIMDAASVEAATLAHRYITYRRLPDSAIDLVDEACSALRVNRELRPEVLDRLEKKEASLNNDILSLQAELGDPDSTSRLDIALAERQAVKNELEGEKTAYDRERYNQLTIEQKKREIEILKRDQEELKTKAKIRKLRTIEKDIKDAQDTLQQLENGYHDHPVYPKRVTPRFIAQIVAEQTKIPIAALISNGKPECLDIEDILSKTIIGQPEAVRAMSEVVSLSRSGLIDPSRPIASLLLAGPSGSGKTFLAKKLAELLLESPDRLLHINASEYSQPLSLSRLIGLPMCSGFNTGGQLTECVKRKPFSVVLVDNIEKACGEFVMKFQTIIDEGFLADGDGKIINFRNCILLLTTSVGSLHVKEPGKVEDEVLEKVLGDIYQTFPTEFLNRLDDIITLRILSPKDLSLFLEKRLNDLQLQLRRKGIELIVDHLAKQHLLSSVNSANCGGARGLERRIQVEIVDRLLALRGLGPGRVRLAMVNNSFDVIRG